MLGGRKCRAGSKETYCSVKRGLLQCQKRPIAVSKERGGVGQGQMEQSVTGRKGRDGG